VSEKYIGIICLYFWNYSHLFSV